MRDSVLRDNDNRKKKRKEKTGCAVPFFSAGIIV